MMYITLKDGTEINLHIGEKLKCITQDIIGIQADGDELEKCLIILDRKSSFRVHTFVGDQALEIVENWERK